VDRHPARVRAEPGHPAYDTHWQPPATRRGAAEFVGLKGGVYEVGHAGDGFCFDNELPRHKVYIAPFELSARLVTNADYLAFIEAGGYRNPSLWLAEGWDWIRAQGIEAPLYWHFVEGQWHRYALAGFEAVSPDEPVTHVSFYEAAAYAEYRGMRLPTEVEWEAASERFSWGQRWEHTNSAYLPYPGYRPAAGALGEYNGKFMSNQMVLRGGSCATPRDHIRSSYRNFFPAGTRWQFSGIRLARDA